VGDCDEGAMVELIRTPFVEEGGDAGHMEPSVLRPISENVPGSEACIDLDANVHIHANLCCYGVGRKRRVVVASGAENVVVAGADGKQVSMFDVLAS
jgi:hypothetical protein